MYGKYFLAKIEQPATMNIRLYQLEYQRLSKSESGEKMELELKEYKLIVESAPNMIWRAGLDAKCDYFNRTWLNFTGRTLEQEVGDGWTEGVHPDDYNHCVQIYLDSFAKRESFEMEYRLRRFDGNYRWINDRGVPIYDEGVFIGYIGSCIDVTEKIEGQLFKEQAQKDGLCNIYNRYYLDRILEYHIERNSEKRSCLAVIMLDIDNFKLVNDQYGHNIGDIVLQQVAAVITDSIRENDICGRYGGEEFVVVLNDTSRSHALEVAERIRIKIAEKTIAVNTPEYVSISVTISGGISFFRTKDTIMDLYQRADRGLYLAKRSGKNCIKIVDNA